MIILQLVRCRLRKNSQRFGRTIFAVMLPWILSIGIGCSDSKPKSFLGVSKFEPSKSEWLELATLVVGFFSKKCEGTQIFLPTGTIEGELLPSLSERCYRSLELRHEIVGGGLQEFAFLEIPVVEVEGLSITRFSDAESAGEHGKPLLRFTSPLSISRSGESKIGVEQSVLLFVAFRDGSSSYSEWILELSKSRGENWEIVNAMIVGFS